MLFVQLLAIFGAGLVSDALLALYTRAVADGRPTSAATASGVVALVNLCVIGAILAWMADRGVLAIVVFAAGNWLGTYLAVRRAARRDGGARDSLRAPRGAARGRIRTAGMRPPQRRPTRRGRAPAGRPV